MVNPKFKRHRAKHAAYVAELELAVHLQHRALLMMQNFEVDEPIDLAILDANIERAEAHLAHLQAVLRAQQGGA